MTNPHWQNLADLHFQSTEDLHWETTEEVHFETIDNPHSGKYSDMTFNYEMYHLNELDSLKSFDSKYQYVNVLLRQSFPFKDEADPEAWIQRLVYAPNPNIKQIVKFIKRAFGADHICSEQSELLNIPITIIDALSHFISINPESDKAITETILSLINATIEEK